MDDPPGYALSRSFVGDIQSGDRRMKTIVVLGMHRSATSLIAKGLANEINMGSVMLEPQEDNPEGFYENKYFVALNSALFANAGGSWDNPPSIKDLKEANTGMNDTIRAVVKQEQRQPIWGWKDPRTALTIDLYLPYLNNPHFVCVYRNPREVAKSLFKRDGIPIDKGIALAVEYNSRIRGFMDMWLDISGKEALE